MIVVGSKFDNSHISGVKTAMCGLEQAMHRLDRRGWGAILSPALLGIEDGSCNLKASSWSFTITASFAVIVTLHDLQEQGPDAQGVVAWRKRGDCKFEFSGTQEAKVLLWPPKFGCGVDFMYVGRRYRCVRFHEDNQMVYECIDDTGRPCTFEGQDELMMVHV